MLSKLHITPNFGAGGLGQRWIQPQNVTRYPRVSTLTTFRDDVILQHSHEYDI